MIDARKVFPQAIVSEKGKDAELVIYTNWYHVEGSEFVYEEGDTGHSPGVTYGA